MDDQNQTVWRNCSSLVDGFWYVRYFAFVVERDEDDSGIMKSCFVVIVVNDVVGQGRGAIRTDCWRNRSFLVDEPRGRPVLRHRRAG